MRKLGVCIAAALPLLSGGCVAKTVLDIATLPVRATAQVVDWTTTSQSEADRNAGRAQRRRDEAAGRDARRRGRDQERRDRDRRD